MMKGDALIVFLQRPSVVLAVKVMHGRPFRAGSGTTMTVQEASFQARPQQQDGQAAKKPGAKSAGPGASKKKAPAQKQTDRLLGWGGFDDVHKASEVSLCQALVDLRRRHLHKFSMCAGRHSSILTPRAHKMHLT
jgi:hypothetical protein